MNCKIRASKNNQKSPDETCRSSLSTFSVLERTCDWWLFQLVYDKMITTRFFPVTLPSGYAIGSEWMIRKPNYKPHVQPGNPTWILKLALFERRYLFYKPSFFVYPGATIPGCKSIILEKNILETFRLWSHWSHQLPKSRKAGKEEVLPTTPLNINIEPNHGGLVQIMLLSFYGWWL